jgi:glycosyltransferase involved in cell wall biosynthesis/mannosyltransferase OCH1-like enzyme
MLKRTINYCWFGKKEKPPLVKKCIESWKKYCPDYEIIEWNEENYDITKNQYMLEAYKAKKWAFVSDFARLDIIYNNGGIYLDTDVELLKPLESLIEPYDAFFCYEKTKINTGLGFGAEKENIIVKELKDSYEKIHFTREDGTYDLVSCVKRNDPIFKKYIMKKKNGNLDNIAFFPKDYFCPLEYETKKLNKTENTIAIHWYGESWLSDSKRIQNKLKFVIRRTIGEENFKKIKNSIKKVEIIKLKIKYNVKRKIYKKFYASFKTKHSEIDIGVEEAEKYIENLRKHYNIEKRENIILAEKKYDLTIIVSAYNSEKTIKKCIDSIINQKTSYKYYIKVVNDGSEDNTKKILDSYDNKIEIIEQENKGRSEARNTAIKVIDSEYIMFVDSDDYIAEDCVEVLLKEAYSNNYDIVEGGLLQINEKKKKKNVIKSNNKSELNGFPINKVYRSEIWKKNFFLPGYEFEDTINKFMIYPFWNKKKKIEDVTYYYCVNELGITQKSLFDTISVDSFLITRYYIDKIINENLIDKSKLLNIFIGQVVVNYRRCRYLDEKIQKYIFVLTCELMEKYWDKFNIDDELFRALKSKDYYQYKINCMIR